MANKLWLRCGQDQATQLFGCGSGKSLSLQFYSTIKRCVLTTLTSKPCYVPSQIQRASLPALTLNVALWAADLSIMHVIPRDTGLQEEEEMQATYVKNVKTWAHKNTRGKLENMSSCNLDETSFKFEITIHHIQSKVFVMILFVHIQAGCGEMSPFSTPPTFFSAQLLHVLHNMMWDHWRGSDCGSAMRNRKELTSPPPPPPCTHNTVNYRDGNVIDLVAGGQKTSVK